MKTLVLGKAAIAVFAYCALKTMERMFGQPHAVRSAHLDEFCSLSPLKKHNSDKVLANTAAISALVGVSRSLKYEHDLSSALLGQALQKYARNMKEAWSMNNVKKTIPYALRLQRLVERQSEDYERMKVSKEKQSSTRALTH